MKLRVILTQKCNLDCVFCSKERVGNRAQLMNKDDYLFLLKNARQYFDTVTLTGGEPTLCDYLH